MEAIYKLLIFCLIFSLAANLYWGYYFYPKWFPHQVDIPNQTQINNFCKEQEFDYGWLSSSSCGENEVQCYRKLLDLSQFKCIKWVN